MKRELAALPPLACKLLAAICRELAGILETDLHKLPSDRMTAGRIRLAVKEAHMGILPINLDAWLGHFPNDAERRAAHRALDALCNAGYLVRLTGPTGRTTHVRLVEPLP